jgi:phosphate transport system permease protein
VTIGALTYIAFLPPAPIQLQPELIFQPTRWLFSPFVVLPIQMFTWVSRPDPRFQANAAAAGVVLMLVTLGVNGLAILLRSRMRKRIQW